MTVKELLDRYGPTLALAAVLVLLVVLLPGNDKVEQVSGVSAGSQADSLAETAGGAEVSEPGNVAGATETVSQTGAGASGPRTQSTARTATGAVNEPIRGVVGGIEFGTGPNCRPDGRQKAISAYTAPCVNWKPGTSNGGATGKGVHADRIVLVRYVAQANAATQAALQGAGASDSPEDTKRMFEAIVRFMNLHMETYGRQVVVVDVNASGPSDNDEAMRADAVRVADEIKAFAVVGAPNTMASELARRGVVCLCTTSLSKTFYMAHPPYIYSTLPTVEEYYSHVADYWSKRLANKNAQWAGDATFRTQKRRFGLIWYEGAGTKPEPGYKAGRDFFVSSLLPKTGVKLSAEVSFLFDLTKAGEQSANMIAKMKDAGVTTVTLSIDPLYPIFITKEATKQNYFPEWFNQGTALTDTAFFGRTYDQAQWRNSFGISPLSLQPTDFRQTPGYREYFHARPNDDEGKQGVAINVVRSPLQILFNGIEMTGPKLNADTFAQGLFRYPRTQASPASALVYFTREAPMAVKDFTEIWWDFDRTGRDEVNKDGVGMLMRVDGGRRYEMGGWPAGDPKVFVDAGAVATSDEPHPAHEQDGHKHPDAQKCLSCV